MKKVKIILGLIVVALAGTVIYQNSEYFFAKTALTFTLVLFKTFHWTLPEVSNIAFFGASLVIGLVIAGGVAIASWLSSRKATKELNATIESQQETINSLKSQLSAFTQDPYQKPAAPVQEESKDEEDAA